MIFYVFSRDRAMLVWAVAQPALMTMTRRLSGCEPDEPPASRGKSVSASWGMPVGVCRRLLGDTLLAWPFAGNKRLAEVGQVGMVIFHHMGLAKGTRANSFVDLRHM